MSAKQIRNTAKVLLLLYIGYFGCISYFIHSHVYNGVVYVHSHPYKKWAKDKDDNKEPPFETHHHTSAGFFTINQLSSVTSFEAANINCVTKVNVLPTITLYEHYLLQDIIQPDISYFHLRAPPISITTA